MSRTYFRLDCHRQTGAYWTTEERAKGTFIAKRAILRGCDAIQAVKSYMGMDDENAALCARRAASQLRNEYRREPAAGAQ